MSAESAARFAATKDRAAKEKTRLFFINLFNFNSILIKCLANKETAATAIATSKVVSHLVEQSAFDAFTAAKTTADSMVSAIFHSNVTLAVYVFNVSANIHSTAAANGDSTATANGEATSAANITTANY